MDDSGKGDLCWRGSVMSGWLNVTITEVLDITFNTTSTFVLIFTL